MNKSPEPMIKKILLALDSDSDTPVALRYAIEIAQRYDAEITALAVIDLGGIEAESRGGGIGSMYYGEKLRESLTEETRQKAQELIREFEELIAGSGVRHTKVVKEGVPYDRIIEDAKYHDLLVIGREPHFFYSRPKQYTKTLAAVVEDTVSPTLIVGDEYRAINRVLIAYDESHAAAQAMREFLQLQPFGTAVEVDILNVYEEDASESELRLNLAKEYVSRYGFNVKAISRQGREARKEIIAYAKEIQADLVVAGAHSRSGLRKLAFGSNIDLLVEQFPAPLFLDR